MIVNDCVRRRNYTKKTASGIMPDAVFYGIYAGESENHLAYVVALTTDVEAAGGILYAYALEVVVFNGSVEVEFDVHYTRLFEGNTDGLEVYTTVFGFLLFNGSGHELVYTGFGSPGHVFNGSAVDREVADACAGEFNHLDGVVFGSSDGDGAGLVQTSFNAGVVAVVHA